MRPKSEIYTPKRDEEYSHPFHMRSSPLPHRGGRLPLNRYLIYYLLNSLLKIITFQQTKKTNQTFNVNWIPKETKFMPYNNLRSIAVFVGRANKPRWARSTKPPFYTGWPCSGRSCIVVKNPAGYISFCLNSLYLNLMIQEAIVIWPVQTG